MKHHNQSLLKGFFKESNKRKLEVVNQFETIMTIENEEDALLLDVYHQSTINKNMIHHAYEKVRNDVFDIWQNLDNVQKNHLLSIELHKVFSQLPHFSSSDTMIYVAFFDELLNALIDKRTAIFELPQFFKLYKSYKDRVINPMKYGHLPFASGFSDCIMVYHNHSSLMLYHPIAKVFYVLSDSKIVLRLPFQSKAVLDIEVLKELARLIEENDVTAIKSWLVHHDVLSKKAKKATNRRSFNSIYKL